MTRTKAIKYWKRFLKEIDELEEEYPKDGMWKTQREATIIALDALQEIERKHGKWEWVGEDRWNDCYRCSVCGKLAMDDSAFCPSCGAIMNGVGKHHSGL